MKDPTARLPPDGLLRSELYLGEVVGVTAARATVRLSQATASASYIGEFRYGRGEVGEMVLLEGQVDLTLGRIVETKAPTGADDGPDQLSTMHADGTLGFVQLLGTVQPDTGTVSAGVETYPRIGDRVFCAPLDFVSKIPALMAQANESAPLSLNIGSVAGQASTEIRLRPEKLFGRHCAILGATGGGKSWTVSRLIEECLKHNARVLLLDATGEYRSLNGEHVVHHHIGTPVHRAPGSNECSIPPDSFQEGDFLAMFEPSGRVQGPKLREAIKSLRLVRILQQHSPVAAFISQGVLKKVKEKRQPIDDATKKNSEAIEHPATPFDATKLARQLMEECVFPEGGSRTQPDPSVFGEYNDGEKAYCLSLGTRIHALTTSASFAPVFRSAAPSLMVAVDDFCGGAKRLLRVCLSGISYEFRSRELIANAIGRTLLARARRGDFSNSPLVVIVDEAHNFLGHSVGSEDSAARLDAFELIAREGRKYGLNLCLATQRPRDLTEGVLSQMGTLIVHRLTNDRDREIVERASGEIDRSATAFLANLRQGEATIVGVDFPIPLTIQVSPPSQKPMSDGPDYQAAWNQTPPVA